MLARVPAVRDFFLVAKNYADCSSGLVKAFGELIRKIWNPRAFKGQVRRSKWLLRCAPRRCFGLHPGPTRPLAAALWQVSPHEFMQEVIKASQKRFLIEKQV